MANAKRNRLRSLVIVAIVLLLLAGLGAGFNFVYERGLKREGLCERAQRAASEGRNEDALALAREALASEPGIHQEIRELADADVAQRLGLEHPSPEGWFFPDTYNFSHGTSDLRILRRAHELMKSHLAAQWEKRAQNLPLASPYEALILASIIEKETGKPDERRLIASVFVNRLRAGMRLQTDPTVIYGLGEAFDGNLRKADLLADTAWNTYTRQGLPPTPIAMPGLASLAAALGPADSDALYFVAKGDGSHQFSRSLGEHDRAVTKYQKSGRR